MPTAVIIGILTVGLFLLVAIAVTMQTIEKNKKEKRQRESALTSRARNFQYMLDGFPSGFLSHDLQILVCKSLLEIYEQLQQSDPGNKSHSGRKELIHKQLDQYNTKTAKTAAVTLTDPAQIKEIQKLLTSLHGFIAKLMGSKRINAAEGKLYSQQIHHLMVQTTTDTLTQAINDALKNGKTKLACHYLQMIIDKMQKENASGHYSDRIASYQQHLDKLTQDRFNSEEESKQRRAEADEEWDNIDKPDGSWKKNSVYD